MPRGNIVSDRQFTRMIFFFGLLHLACTAARHPACGVSVYTTAVSPAPDRRCHTRSTSDDRQVEMWSPTRQNGPLLLTQAIELSYLPAAAECQPRLCPPRPRRERGGACFFFIYSCRTKTRLGTGGFGNSQVCIVEISLIAYQVGYKRASYMPRVHRRSTGGSHQIGCVHTTWDRSVGAEHCVRYHRHLHLPTPRRSGLCLRTKFPSLMVRLSRMRLQRVLALSVCPATVA